MKVTIEVNPAKATLSDEPVLTLSIDSEEGVKVQKPPFGGSLGSFIIRDFREPTPKIHDGRELIQQIYTLEPTETGKVLVDPITIAFTDNRPNGDGRSHTIETESITVEITSILGDKAPSLGDLRPSADPVDLPSSVSFWLWGVAAAGVMAVPIAWWLIRRRRQEKSIAAKILTPEEVALRELDALERSGLAARDIKLFYVELTGIVRRYIEQATGIRAPEQTTEEFLREISREGSIGLWRRNATASWGGSLTATRQQIPPQQSRRKVGTIHGGHQERPPFAGPALTPAGFSRSSRPGEVRRLSTSNRGDRTESVRRARLFINIRSAEQAAIRRKRATA